LERNKRRILLVSLIYFLLSLPTLLSGFRGVFLSFWLTFYIFYKYKFNHKISFKSLVIIIILVSLVSLYISYIRENPSTTEISLSDNFLLEFLKQQGVSFFVTAMAIEFYDEFADKILNYLMWEPIGSIFSHLLSLPGRSFANDLTIKINYNAFSLGYGTGSSYLAEAYLLGGPFVVSLISLFLGFILSKLFIRFGYSNVFIKILIFTLIQFIIYLPRDLLLMPLSVTLKTGIYVLITYILFTVFKNILLIKKGESNENTFSIK
jgi:hypothetical protein